jgi:hypothetical protein
MVRWFSARSGVGAWEKNALGRRLDGAGLAIVATVSLSGCFSSRAPLLPAGDGVKMFGESGAATRFEFGAMNGAPVRVAFTWKGDSYAIADPREPRSQALYRIAPMPLNWLLTQRVDHGVAIYGLARREADRLWTYSPACQDLADSDRVALNLTIQPDGMCWLTSIEQLKTAMRKFADKNLQPDGYFEIDAR